MKTFLLTGTSFLSFGARWGRQCVVLLLSALLGSLGAPAAHAQENPGLAGVYKAHDLSYRVWGCNPARQAGRIQLVSETGKVLYEQRSAATNLGGVLNLSDLPDGRYAFKIEMGREMHRFDVLLRTTAQRLAEVTDDQTPTGAHLLSAARPTGAAH